MSTAEIQQTINQELLSKICTARELLSAHDSPVDSTRILYDPELSNKYSANIWLASELHQPIGAYKIRGAYNFFQNIPESDKGKVVVTASAGNHAQGIALSSRLTGNCSEIFMPTCTPDQKVKQVAIHGDESVKINLVGENFDEAELQAMKFVDRHDAVYASPFNNYDVIAGQGTWGLEIADYLNDIDLLFCPVGGMGLLAGISSAIKSRQPRVDVVGVEPNGAASLSHALELGSPDALSQIDTFIDGAAVKRVGDLPFELASRLLSDVVTVDNQDVRKTTTDLWQRQQPIKTELAGALSVTALQYYAKKIIGKNVVCLVTGGNLSEARFNEEVRL